MQAAASWLLSGQHLDLQLNPQMLRFSLHYDRKMIDAKHLFELLSFHSILRSDAESFEKSTTYDIALNISNFIDKKSVLSKKYIIIFLVVANIKFTTCKRIVANYIMLNWGSSANYSLFNKISKLLYKILSVLFSLWDDT